ncbi:MAG TPA: CocE/NonD family hydrolase, partial [Gemmatimonadaceae bacterium]|nr:CocE/NonD family hydrolase [Gemmatimonadaceae bacterium]
MIRSNRSASLLVFALCAAASSGPLARIAAAQSTATPAPASPSAQPAKPEFEKTEVQIPMRDGVRLNTDIYVPKGISTDLPIIFFRTPYGIAGAERVIGTGSTAELAADGYIFALQDIRGRFKSEGQFVMLRQMRNKSDPKAIDESTDAYDTIDWLVKNVPHNNGRVGMKGVSYPGWLTVIAMLDPHPALKAVSPQASPADMFIGDDFHHNGAFRLSYGFEYAAAMEASKVISPFAFDQPDLYDWYLKVGSLANINPRFLHGKMPTWNDFVSHPSYDSFWQRQSFPQNPGAVKVPTLHVAGFWDQEDFYGPVKIYETLEPSDTEHRNYLVIGPWNHGGWGGASGQKLGSIDFGSPTSLDFRKNIEAPWFAYWLWNKGTVKLPEATTFESGGNSWQSFDSWPPRTGFTKRPLYFRAGKQLSFDRPSDASDNAFDSYVSDPANPVPYRKRPIVPLFAGAGNTWSRWLVDDQRFDNDRPDVVIWETPSLGSDVVIAGAISAHLFASTTGSDADWVVKLIDVYPARYEPDSTLNGYELMVANDVLRGRFRKSFEHPQAITPNRTEEYVVDLHTQNYRFSKGHKIQVQVQSSW